MMIEPYHLLSDLSTQELDFHFMKIHVQSVKHIRLKSYAQVE